MSCWLAACVSIAERPDLERLYSAAAFPTKRARPMLVDQPPVVVVPGLLGSRLVDTSTGEEYWPGSAISLAFGDYPELALPFDAETGKTLPSNLKVNGITEIALGRDFYERLLMTLSKFGHFQRTEIGSPIQDRSVRRFYVFAYDWRRDNVETARAFDAFLARIREDYADPNLKVDVVAHSMGGLMVRYFLRYGTEDVLDSNEFHVSWAGAKHINKVILLGTPSLGSVSAIAGMATGQPVGFGTIPPEVVATMPSTYQLFPHRIVDWLYSLEAQDLDLDEFDPETWRSQRWGVFDPAVEARVIQQRGSAYLRSLQSFFARSIERARRFSWSLTICPNYNDRDMHCGQEFAEPPIRYVVFGGSCEQTPARAVLEEGQLRLTPADIRHPRPGVDYAKLMLDPGDGTVTKPSLLARDALEPYTPRHQYSYFPLAYAFLLCERHDQLTGNLNFQDNLLDVLLTRAKPWELHLDHDAGVEGAPVERDGAASSPRAASGGGP